MVALAVAALACAGGGVARAGSGGGASGGLSAPKPPVAEDLSCLDRCADLREVAARGKVVITGRHLSNVDAVKFRAKSGKVEAKTDSASGKQVEVKVPSDAVSGKPKVFDPYGASSKVPVGVKIVPESALPEPGELRLSSASVSSSKVFFDGDKSLQLRYLFNSSSPKDVRIDLIKGKGGTVARSWVQHDQKPASFNTLDWDGTVKKGKSAKAGQYRFRIGALSGSGGSGGEKSTAFGYYDYKFPVRGAHNFGGAGAGFGAGRAGHSHQGQDVMASCGTPLEAARGGKVQYKAFQRLAGNYVIIDGAGTGRDFGYMHLKEPASVKEGERVHTGERIGIVGQTGDATACHLHFEMWKAPGWYQGGHPFDPLPSLKRWDRWS
jgi:murein DD-endopeptidase MepM/ murein hydrolase activator NlpD